LGLGASGKSTLAKNIALHENFKHYYSYYLDMKTYSEEDADFLYIL
jgi:adenylylsulfate kinase-like enzyme